MVSILSSSKCLTMVNPHIWHLNQDLILSLGLKREGNSWICPMYGYTQVARLKVTENNKPTLLEIKAEYLKDYLCAREYGALYDSLLTVGI